MEHRTIEGTWEEVSRMGRELAGHRVRVIVLDPCEAPGVGKATQANDPILGLFRDSPQLLDDVVEEAMRIREERPWRLPAGE